MIKAKDESGYQAFANVAAIFFYGSVRHSAADEGDVRGGRPSGVLE